MWRNEFQQLTEEQDDLHENIFNKLQPDAACTSQYEDTRSYRTEVEKAGCGSIQRYAHRTIHNSICHGNKGNCKWLKFNVLPITQPGRGTTRASGESKRSRELLHSSDPPQEERVG